MSTKTLRKRIALVAVSALGFGLVSVAPGWAASADNDDYVAVVATLDTATTNHAGRVNNQVSINITGSTTTAAGDVSTLDAGSDNIGFLSLATAMTSQPVGSSAQISISSVKSALGTTLDFVNANQTIDADATAIATGVTDTSTASRNYAAINYGSNTAGEDISAITAGTTLATITFTPTVVGTYTFTVWNETRTWATHAGGADVAQTSLNAVALSGSESYQTFTVNVTAGITSMTLTPTNAVAPKAAADSATDIGYWGSQIKVSLLDASGNPAALAAGEIVSIDPSGTGDVIAVNATSATTGVVAATAGAAWSLTASDFTNGVAWINVNNATAEVVTIVATSGAVTATTSVEYVAVVAGAFAPKALSTGWAANTSPALVAPFTNSITYTLTGTADKYSAVRVSDTQGKVSGRLGGRYDVAVKDGATAGTGSFTVGATCAAGECYEISDDATDAAEAAGSQDIVVTAQTRAVNATNSSVTPSAARVATAGSVSIIALIKDQFGVAYANGRVTLSIAGRNAAQAAKSGTTNATGQVSFTVTDTALASSLLTTDTITVSAFDETGTPITETASITWSSTAVDTVVLTAEDELSTVAGTVTTDIAAGSTGATGASSTVTATVKDAAGNLMAGVPVVFTVTGLTGAEVHTTKVTVYTGTDGIATSLISSYAAGKATVTATAGGKSDSDSVYFKQKTATEVRTIAATVAGRVITATATDRYGNAVEGVALQASIDGNGFFGTGTNIASANTDKNGQVKFLLLEGNAAVKVTVTTSTALYGQTADAAGKVGTGAAAVAVTAAAAGDALTNQTGLGAALAPAGINSVDVTVAADTATSDAATAAADAAAEATDAANAATDAANAAAEAADAATAAAQDAADAVAALSTSVTEMVNALKKQITSLTNLVIKIQKKVRA
jgi:hypothetical protein